VLPELIDRHEKESQPLPHFTRARTQEMCKEVLLCTVRLVRVSPTTSGMSARRSLARCDKNLRARARILMQRLCVWWGLTTRARRRPISKLSFPLARSRESTRFSAAIPGRVAEARGRGRRGCTPRPFHHNARQTCRARAPREPVSRPGTGTISERERRRRTAPRRAMPPTRSRRWVWWGARTARTSRAISSPSLS
jgi:hypothetical protein